MFIESVFDAKLECTATQHLMRACVATCFHFQLTHIMSLIELPWSSKANVNMRVLAIYIYFIKTYSDAWYIGIFTEVYKNKISKTAHIHVFMYN